MKKLQELIEAKAKILSENKDDNVMNVSVPWIQADKKNQNGRTYPKSLLQREIARVQSSVKKGSFIGTGDHPFSGIENIATASHIVTALSLDEKGQGWAEMRILPTERGKTIQTLIRNGATLGVSCRGFGNVGDDGRVSDDYKLVGVDVVTNPSFKNAVFDKSNIFESVEFEEENEVEKELESAINDLEKQSFLGAVESGFKGTEEEWHRMYGGGLREMVGLPVLDRETPVQKLTEEQIKNRTYGYFLEAQKAGYLGSFPEWKEKYPRLVEMASEAKVVLSEKKEEPKAPFKSKITWNEVVASGFIGTMDEWREKFPNIELIAPISPQKPIVERTLKQEAARIFTALSKENPNSQLTLESVIEMLEKEGESKREKKTRELAIYRVNKSLAGSGSDVSQQILTKMVDDEVKAIKEEKEERKRKNWQAYKRLLD